jgi:hypothetical protein
MMRLLSKVEVIFQKRNKGVVLLRRRLRLVSKLESIRIISILLFQKRSKSVLLRRMFVDPNLGEADP